MNCKLSKLLLIGAIYTFGTSAYSQDAISPIKTINPNATSISTSILNMSLNSTKDSTKNIYLSKKDTSSMLINATDKFVQCNVRVAWSDFKSLANMMPDNDFNYLIFANKMAEIGFFDLADLTIKYTKDPVISRVSTDAMKRFYYPNRKLKQEDELILAEAYSNIMFNNKSSEAVSELERNETLINNSDYANYMVALGAYKSNSFAKAAKYINLAILQNSSNLNYQTLKARILVEQHNNSEALKIIQNLKKQNLFATQYERKITSLEQFILYKTSKYQGKKNYHLGYYYHLENDDSKSIRTLQSALSDKRHANKAMIYGLMSEVYFSMKEYEKASDMAKKSHKINSHIYPSLMTLGNISYLNGKYNNALGYYKSAERQNKKAFEPMVKQASTYQKLNNTKKANEIYTKILKTHSDCAEAYYNVALLNPDRKEVYLKKAVAVNLLYKDAWLELSKLEIDRNNYENAKKYLSNAFYIDENDYRYYYYQGLVCYHLKDDSQAKYNFKKSLKLNPNNKNAQTLLDSLLQKEDNQGSVL